MTETGETKANENNEKFKHIRQRFLQSVALRIKRDYPNLGEPNTSQISEDINASLIGFFREGGLSLATILFTEDNPARRNVLPSSILKFITEASTRYGDYLSRQVFVTTAIDIFARAEQIDKEYLGQIAQGYFAYHALGMFGDFATEKLKLVKDSIWLVDSNVQIAVLSPGTSTNIVIRDTLYKLREMGIRFFTTDNIFNETWDHLYFADKVIEKNGVSSPSVLAAATGQPPYRKSNLFLEGFINWQTVGNPPDWRAFLFQIIESAKPNKVQLENALRNIGIEVIPFSSWPGYTTNDLASAEEYKEEIVNRIQNLPIIKDLDQMTDPYKKAKPESEVMVIIDKERNGNYYIMSDKGTSSMAWFISDTSLLNSIYGHKITWQPDAFLRFTLTLYPISNEYNSERAFQIILLGLAQSGLRMLHEKSITTIFGSAIDQTRLTLSAQLAEYKDYVQEKYGESPQKVLERIPFQNIAWAAIQFANDIVEIEATRRQQAEIAVKHANERVKVAEQEAGKLKRYKKKMDEKAAARLRTKRRKQSQKKK